MELTANTRHNYDLGLLVDKMECASMAYEVCHLITSPSGDGFNLQWIKVYAHYHSVIMDFCHFYIRLNCFVVNICLWIELDHFNARPISPYPNTLKRGFKRALLVSRLWSCIVPTHLRTHLNPLNTQSHRQK